MPQHYSGESHKEQAVNEAYDYYKNLYLSYYGSENQPSSAEAGLEVSSPTKDGEVPAFITDTANKIKGVFNRQDQLGGFGEIDDVSNYVIYESLIHQIIFIVNFPIHLNTLVY